MENVKKKRNSFYNPIYISKRDNLTIEEAIEKIETMKRNKSTSLYGFIHRHGEELGKIKFEEFQNSSKHTKEKFIEKYGEEKAEVKWIDYLKTKDSTSFEWALKKANGDDSIAKDIHAERIKSLSIRFDDDYFMKKYGENYQEEKIKFFKSRDTSSYEWALNKSFGESKKADKIYSERCIAKSVMFGSTSKESLLTFEPILDWLTELGFENDDIMIGKENNKELCIHDSEKKYRYYYDFCINSLKLIIEYNGETFHPNYEKYTLDYLVETFKHPYIKKFDVENLIYKDKQKIEFALKDGYEIHVIWSSDQNKIEKIKNIIKNKIIYENKKNY